MARRVALTFVIALLLGSAASPVATSAPRRCTRADVLVRFHLDQFRYDRDEPVRMKMTVKNVSRRRCTMRWSDGNFGSLIIRRDGGRLVWTDESCAAYTQAIVEERWAKRHREVYGGVWRQHRRGDPDTCRNDGPLARPGLYFARGLFEGAGGVRSHRVWFRLTK